MHVTTRLGRQLGLALVLTLVLAMTVASQLPAYAATFTVDTTADDPAADDCDGDDPLLDCSLRGAIILANTTPGADVIELPAGTYTLTVAGTSEDAAATGDLDITEELTITGADTATTIVDAAGIDRVFHTVATTAISSLTVTNGDVSGGTGAVVNDGGGLLSEAATTLSGVAFEGNAAGRAGGGIEVRTGSLTATDVDFTANSANVNGGAVHVSTGTTDFTGGEVSMNTAAREGGGFWNGAAGSTMTVDGTTFTSNTASGAASDNGGGSLFNNGGSLIVRNVTSTGGAADGAAGSGGGLLSIGGSIDIDDSSFDDGSASRAGGGIELVDRGGMTPVHTSVDLDEVSFDGNVAGSSPGNGGAVHVTGPIDLTIDGGTVANNTAANEGGGFWNGSGTMTVTGTTFTGNVANGTTGSPAADPAGGGSLFNNGGTLNLSGVTSTGGRAPGGMVWTSGTSGGGLLSFGGALDIDSSSFDGGSARRAGGGIEIVGAHTSIALDDVDFDGNSAGSAPGNGGAIHVTGDPGTDVSITGGDVTNNTAGREGGGFWNDRGTMVVDGTTFTDNSASGDAPDTGGGSLFNNGGSLTVLNVASTGGAADGLAGSGGGLLSVGGSIDIDDSSFDDGSANRAGGGIELVDRGGMTPPPAHSSVDLDNVDFDGNSVGATPGNGGAIHVTGDIDLTIDGGDVTNNTAAAEGGGFWNGSGTMTVTGTTFTANTASGADATNGGGSLFNNLGTLEVDDIVSTDGVADGAAGSGGGIFTDGGTLTVTDSIIRGGDANRAGGAIETNGSAVATITGSTLLENNAGINGGAVHITGGGDVTITTSLVSGNTALAEGGGLWNSSSGLLTVTESLVVDNDAQGTAEGNGGGGLFSDGGDIAVTNSTVSGNTAANEGSQLYVVGGSTDLTFATIAEPAGSDAEDGVAAIGSTTLAPQITLTNTIIAVDSDDACDGNITSGGGNVVSDATCDLDGTGDLASTDPAVAALADNGGPTRTHALQATSPAIGAAVGTCAATDQRGTARPSSGCDTGAFESPADEPGEVVPPDTTAPDTTITSGPQGAVTTTSTLTYRFTSDDSTATFECRITGGITTPYRPCTSPTSYRLTDGSYRFSVRAKDAAGNIDATPAFRDVTIDTDDEFVDDDDSIFEADIERLHAAGITKGCNPPTNDRFCPEDNLTREQMAAFLVRALDLPAARERFTDVDSSNTFAADIGALQASGITKGCNPPENDEFCPKDLVPRKEMAAFLRRGLELAGAPERFRDVASNDTFARDIGAIAKAGITKGCNPPTNDRFCPDDFVTRGELAAFFVRAGLT